MYIVYKYKYTYTCTHTFNYLVINMTLVFFTVFAHDLLECILVNLCLSISGTDNVDVAG